MLLEKLRGFVHGKDGMEMVEWSAVGVLFAIAAALSWTALRGDMESTLQDVGSCVSAAACPVGTAGDASSPPDSSSDPGLGPGNSGNGKDKDGETCCD